MVRNRKIRIFEQYLGFRYKRGGNERWKHQIWAERRENRENKRGGEEDLAKIGVNSNKKVKIEKIGNINTL